MTDTDLTEIHTRLENFKQKDIKNLVQQHGKLIEGNLEFILKELPSTDSHLHAIINDPHFEIKSIGDQHKSGEMYFDLKAIGKQVRIKVVCHLHKNTTKK